MFVHLSESVPWRADALKGKQVPGPAPKTNTRRDTRLQEHGADILHPWAGRGRRDTWGYWRECVRLGHEIKKPCETRRERL